VALKITFVLPSFHSGGTEWVVLRLARALRDQGFEPSILTLSRQGGLAPLLEGTLPVTDLGDKPYSLATCLKTIPAVIRYLRQEKPEILISNLPYLDLMTALALKLAFGPTRLIAIQHMRQPAPRPRLKKAVYSLILKLTYALADAVVCVSQTVRRDCGLVLSCPSESLPLIYNPVVPDDLEAQIKGALPFVPPTGSPLLLSVGRLLPVKNHRLLLQAFQEIRTSHPDAHLLLICEGDKRAERELRELAMKLGIDKHFTITGMVRNIFPALSRADLFIVPSRQEAFGNVIAEALACGTKVVSTDCGGPREILEDGLYGTLAKDFTPEALAKAIRLELETKRDPQRLRQHGQSFSVARAAHAYAALMRKLWLVSSNKDSDTPNQD